MIEIPLSLILLFIQVITVIGIVISDIGLFAVGVVVYEKGSETNSMVIKTFGAVISTITVILGIFFIGALTGFIVVV